jgi:hypothetical protein
MAADSDWNRITDEHLDQWWAAHDGKDGDGAAADIAIQVRDRLIRQLIDEVRASRKQEATLIEVIRDTTETLRRCRAGKA